MRLRDCFICGQMNIYADHECHKDPAPPSPPEPMVSSRNTSVGMLNKPEQELLDNRWEHIDASVTPTIFKSRYGAEYVEHAAYERVCQERDEMKEHASLCDTANRLNFEKYVRYVEESGERITELKRQVQFTNTGWPHEKKLHERIAELERERDALKGRIEVLSQGWPAADILRLTQERDNLEVCLESTKQALSLYVIERDQWKSEHDNLSKFAEGLRVERDAMKEHASLCDTANRLNFEKYVSYVEEANDRIVELERELEERRMSTPTMNAVLSLRIQLDSAVAAIGHLRAAVTKLFQVDKPPDYGDSLKAWVALEHALAATSGYEGEEK